MTVKLFVDGTETEWHVGSLEVDDQVDQRSTARFRLIDSDENSDITKGTPVVITDDDGSGNVVYTFSGVVDRVQRVAVVARESQGIYLDVDCVDSHWFVDRRVVSLGQKSISCGSTVRRIIRQILREENIYDHPYPGNAVTLSQTWLKGYWRLMDSADDESYLNNNGTDSGAPTYYAPLDRRHLNVTNSSDHAVIADEASFDINADIDIRAEISADTLADGGAQELVARWATDPNNAYILRLDASGNLVLFWSEDGAASSFETSTETVATGANIEDGDDIQVRGTLDADNGSGGYDVTFYWRVVGEDLDTDNDWNQLGSVITGGATTSIASTAADITLGLREAGLSDPFAGKIFAAVVKDGIAGTTVLNVSFLDPDQFPDGSESTSGTADTGQTVTLENGAILVASPVGDDNLGGFAEFDGASDAVDTTLTRFELAENNGGFSVAAWVYPAPGNTDFMIVAAMSSDANLSLGTHVFALRRDSDGTGDTPRFSVTLDDGTVAAAVGSTPLPNSQWTFLLGVADDANEEVRLYVNDTLEDTVAYPAGAQVDYTASANEMVIGDYLPAGGGGDAWEGRLSEVQVVGKPFTDDEASRLYAQAGGDSRVDEGPLLVEANINFALVSDAFEELAEIAETFDYYVDAYRTVHFHARGAACCTAPSNISDSMILTDDGQITLAVEAPKYRNRQYIKGGRDSVEDVQEEFTLGTEDEGRLSFPTGYAILEEPSISVNGVNQTVGIRGAESGFEFYWSKGQSGIVRDSDEPDLIGGDVIEINYTGEFDIVIISEDGGEVSELRQIEKVGSGTVEVVTEDSSINSRQQGFDIIAGQLGRYAVRGQTLKFSTRTSGFRAGQTVTMTFDRLGLESTTALIDRVRLADFQGIEPRYYGQAVTGPALRSWQQFFATPAKRLTIQQERLNIGEQEVGTLLQSFSDTTNWTDDGTAGITVQACTTLSDPGPVLGFTLC